MNYNSIADILSSTNLTVVSNSNNDSTTYTMCSTTWFPFNGTTGGNIYASGNSWLGLNGNREDLKINRRNAMSYQLSYEQGTMHDYWRFCRIYWSGRQHYNNSNYLLKYDVLLFENGSIYLHIIEPTGVYQYTGTNTLTTSTTYTFSATERDVSFYLQEDGSYEIKYEEIVVPVHYEKRMLVRSGETIYTIENNELLELGDVPVTAELFLTKGYGGTGRFTHPNNDKFINIPNPEIMYWQDSDEELSIGIDTVTLPHPQILTSDEYNSTDPTIIGIESIYADADNATYYQISVDHGASWMRYDGTDWVNDGEWMDRLTFIALTEKVLNALITTDASTESYIGGPYMIRCKLDSMSSRVGLTTIHYVNERAE